jgi:hypothetical protein
MLQNEMLSRFINTLSLIAWEQNLGVNFLLNIVFIKKFEMIQNSVKVTYHQNTVKVITRWGPVFPTSTPPNICRPP